jgi:hypothetical protein
VIAALQRLRVAGRAEYATVRRGKRVIRGWRKFTVHL